MHLEQSLDFPNGNMTMEVESGADFKVGRLSISPVIGAASLSVDGPGSTVEILELPDLPVSASCVRVPVVVGHAQSVWVETEEPIAPEVATRVLAAAPGLAVRDVPAHSDALAADEVVVGRIRKDQASERGLVLFLVCDNLRKGAALNAIQISELIVGAGVGVPSWMA